MVGQGHSVVPFHTYQGYESGGRAWGDNTYI
jgi:hypothetical protein